jgi:8-oxo-dGTP diphosphatase
MKELATIGESDSSIDYIDRPTVKVVIKQDDKILIINDGLLPGGGVDEGETHTDAISRELLEELGARVKNIHEIGQVTQYRHFLSKKYLVYGYMAELDSFSALPMPQDTGEAAFVHEYLTKDEALRRIQNSLEKLAIANPEIKSDAIQGKMYNLKTSLVLLQFVN